MAIDANKLNEFMGKFVGDLGAVMHAATVVVDDTLGLYKALAEKPATATELAKRTGTDPRYLREWLSAQTASGYVQYDAKSETFSLTRGAGVCTRFFFRPGYAANLVSQWLPALEGVEAKLKKGARVADVGCGHGASTIIKAQAYPASEFIGFDYHEPSVVQARESAKKAGLGDRVLFEVASAKSFPGGNYDLVTVFDCLHDMGDPVGASAHVRQTLKEDGTWMIVEPFANDRLEENINPVGRIYYSASTFICTPASRSQEVGLCLGAQAGEGRLRSVVKDGGFSKFRRAAETPFNLIFEARA